MKQICLKISTILLLSGITTIKGMEKPLSSLEKKQILEEQQKKLQKMEAIEGTVLSQEAHEMIITQLLRTIEEKSNALTQSPKA